jgi:hypothetical protein
LTTPFASPQEQKYPSLMPTGTQPIAGFEEGGQRHAQDVGDDSHAEGVAWQERPVDPAVPGVNA